MSDEKYESEEQTEFQKAKLEYMQYCEESDNKTAKMQVIGMLGMFVMILAVIIFFATHLK